MSTTRRHEALRRKGERRKADILRASRRIFLEKGYEGTSVQDILDALGCSKGGFYHHFDSKVSVLAEIAAVHARESRGEYVQGAYASPVVAIGALLRRAAFLRQEDLALLRAVRELEGKSDGAILRDALVRASAAAFFQDFTDAALALTRAGLAGFPGEDALMLAFETFLHGGFLLMREAAGDSGGPGRAVSLLGALRRQVESALRLPPGSVEVIGAQELAALAAAVAR
ncbi:MAG TPA: helix-turn-helix domain-containing protein [Candidatus Limnocylindria bacterium]|nr:helix-turn-helix domain-containing protein [Candidatus Limnocylindria bacterium]